MQNRPPHRSLVACGVPNSSTFCSLMQPKRGDGVYAEPVEHTSMHVYLIGIHQIWPQGIGKSTAYGIQAQPLRQMLTSGRDLRREGMWLPGTRSATNIWQLEGSKAVSYMKNIEKWWKSWNSATKLAAMGLELSFLTCSDLLLKDLSCGTLPVGLGAYMEGQKVTQYILGFFADHFRIRGSCDSKSYGLGIAARNT